MRKKHPSKKRRKVVLRKYFLFAIILIILYLFVFKTDYFSVKNIEVVGNKKLSNSEIIKASLCNKGENILKVNTRTGEESIRRLPYVKDCKIKRKFPNTIIIQVEERKEIAAIPYSNLVALIDKEGYVLTIEKDSKNIKLPRLIGLSKVEVKIGDNVFHQVKIENIEQFIVLSDKLGLLDKIEYIDFSDEKNVTFQINQDTNVAFGHLDNVKYKLDFLIKILEDLNKKKIKAKQIFFNKGENPVIVTDNR